MPPTLTTVDLAAPLGPAALIVASLICLALAGLIASATRPSADEPDDETTW